MLLQLANALKSLLDRYLIDLKFIFVWLLHWSGIQAIVVRLFPYLIIIIIKHSKHKVLKRKIKLVTWSSMYKAPRNTNWSRGRRYVWAVQLQVPLLNTEQE